MINIINIIANYVNIVQIESKTMKYILTVRNINLEYKTLIQNIYVNYAIKHTNRLVVYQNINENVKVYIII
jgi:hypothetical protein